MFNTIATTYLYNDRPRIDSFRIDPRKIEPDWPFDRDLTAKSTTTLRCKTWPGEDMPN